MKILIIGASGMLAKPVIRQLDEKGFQLRLFSRSVDPSMFDKAYEMVRGDLFNTGDLQKAIAGCDAIHITISTADEKKATEAVVALAKQHGIKRISMVSGCTVSEENRWFRFIDNKFQAEQLLINSGIPYLIFRPTWFFESLSLMVREGKATLLGKQPHPYHWIAADEFGRMVATAYSREEAANNIFFIYGPRTYLMKELLERYCEVIHPEIKKVSVAPLPMIRLIATLSGNRELKGAAALFSYFQKVEEPEGDTLTNELLGKAEMDFERWLQTIKQG